MCLRKVAAGAGEDGVDVALRLQCDNEVRDVRCRQWWIQAKDEARATIGDVADVIGDFWIDVRVAQPTTDLLHAGERFARVGTGGELHRNLELKPVGLGHEIVRQGGEAIQRNGKRRDHRRYIDRLMVEHPLQYAPVATVEAGVIGVALLLLVMGFGEVVAQ